MRSWILFILILASNRFIGCGFYPYGEDIRFSLLNPDVFGYQTFSCFNYSTHAFSSPEEMPTLIYYKANTKLWFDYCQGAVEFNEVDEAIYRLPMDSIHRNASNKLVQYLFRRADQAGISYLLFAKRCESMNTFFEDPWERKKNVIGPKRKQFIDQAIAFSKEPSNKSFMRRYVFLAIRMAWYNGEYDVVNELFANVFEGNQQKDVLYYWALYFQSLQERNQAKANHNLAQVFAHAEDKKFACQQAFNVSVPIQDVLKYANTDEERSNVYVLYGIMKPNHALHILKEVYALNPKSAGFSFLLLREVNKVEDFVLTPYYTLFQPALRDNYWDETLHVGVVETLKRSERDRLYAVELLEFISSVDNRKVENPLLLDGVKAYLYIIARDYTNALKLIRRLENKNIPSEILRQLEIFKAVALVAIQKDGAAEVNDEIKSIILNNQENLKFLFALGKELERKGNTTDAALLFSCLNIGEDGYSVFWKSNKLKRYAYNDYFFDYFEYVDAVYTPNQLRALLDRVTQYMHSPERYDRFIYAQTQKELEELKDLLGTKYIRLNELENALEVFSSMDTKYWMRKYTTWSDNDNIFRKNPFYHVKYTRDFIEQKDSLRLNKFTITKQLIEYLKRANSPSEQDRDYYYFLVANAYYNMTSQGNIPMMRRMGYWSRESASIIIDEPEFRQCHLAKSYYLRAMEFAKTEKFKALCLRMAARCERNRLLNAPYGGEYLSNENYNKILYSNRYYKELETKYPAYFDDLTSNCTLFKEYFDARREM